MPRASINSPRPANRIVKNDLLTLPPSLSTVVTPKASAAKSAGQNADQGLTYNEPGITYNEPGVMYGGFYGTSDVKPSVSLASQETPRNQLIIDLPGTNPTPPPLTNSGYLIGILGLTYP
jgi:hypothetical protein